MQHLRETNPECVWQPSVLPNVKSEDARTVRFAEDTKKEEVNFIATSNIVMDTIKSLLYVLQSTASMGNCNPKQNIMICVLFQHCLEKMQISVCQPFFTYLSKQYFACFD